MKTRKIIGGVLGCLMLCGLLVGCSGSNNSSSNSNYKKVLLQKVNLPVNGWVFNIHCQMI